MTEKFHMGKNGGKQLIRNQNLFEMKEKTQGFKLRVARIQIKLQS